ncbi:precorrin-3B C(17)-methyltransferase [Acidisphaera rubrifaciens]|uniref:Precorrin-3B C17-methyltransferase n=1 Tax=Acidisphaera rubrifaciens HS-AP3 TaxID=1231350 RepID=A0A0D6P7I1_9PROT|nr:precorrin-3B C(17)-methyltransferase [Acidisphaera rubrifaciens]GAN76829.1 precorrin-3B C17-methyltransferase [Acidisphaera rubrifaciens HS-AP3]
MTGRVTVIGLGPGDDALRTPQADAALAAADDLIGYGPYLDRVRPRAGQRRHPSDNGAELARARLALTLAAEGRHVAVVSGGDAGVFGMASALYEAVEHGPASWAALDIDVVPGVSAMFAAAARVGAPLGHDFCAISLSDNLKSWDTICRRLRAAAEAGFVIALYNPASRTRPWQLAAAFDMLRTVLPPTTPVVFARDVARPGERIAIVPLGEADAAEADMRTILLIGSAATRLIAREGRPPRIYAPRSAQ